MTTFTIKHIKPDGVERIWAARGEVEFFPKRPGALVGEITPETVVFVQPNGVISSIDTGSVYILNGDGRTVARYHLNEPRVELPRGAAAA